MPTVVTERSRSAGYAYAAAKIPNIRLKHHLFHSTNVRLERAQPHISTVEKTTCSQKSFLSNYLGQKMTLVSFNTL